MSVLFIDFWLDTVDTAWVVYWNVDVISNLTLKLYIDLKKHVAKGMYFWSSFDIWYVYIN